jgi:hypothetical protein
MTTALLQCLEASRDPKGLGRPWGPWGPAFVARQLQNLILMESFSTSLSEMVNIGCRN